MKLTEKELNEFPIGTKIHCGNNTIIKADFDAQNWRNMEKHEWYSANILKSHEIDKILIPTYTEYIPPKPILDEKEKEYLSFVIRPFRDKVRKIRKIDHRREHEYLQIMYNDGDFPTDLKDFDTGTMYKGMELYRKYSLEDLGL